MGSHLVSGTPKVLYRCEYQGGPLRIFAHDLDLPLMHAVTGGLDPVHLRLLLPPSHRVGFVHEQSCGQVGNPVTDLPLSKFVVVRRSRGRGGREPHWSSRGGVLFLFLCLSFFFSFLLDRAASNMG